MRAAPVVAVVLGALVVPPAALAEVAPRELRSELPLLVLRTQGPILDDPKVRTRVRVIDHGPRRRNTIRRSANGYDGWGGVELRGRSSQAFPKKPYALELRTRRGAKRHAPLLGLPADDDWVLYPAYNDKSLLRNVVAYAAGRLSGRWAPGTRFVEVVLNGRYEGVYVLTQRIELGRGQVRLPRRLGTPTLLEFSFIEQVNFKGAHFRTPVLNRPVVWEDPEVEALGRARRNRVAAAVGSAEEALFRGGHGAWRQVLQPGAAVDYTLVQELFRNVDAFHASLFLVVPERGKIQLGPLWDFDLSTGNSNIGNSRLTSGWWLPGRAWAGPLMADPTFRAALYARWHVLRVEGFRERLLAALDRHARRVAPAVDRNFARWPVLDQRIWQNPHALGSWTAEVAHLRDWLDARMRWLDAATGFAAPATTG